LQHKFADWIIDNEYMDARTYERMLNLAGVIKRVPFMFVETCAVRTPDDKQAWDHVPVMGFRAVAPMWAVEIAQHLDYNVPLIRRLGGYREVENKSRRWSRNAAHYTGERAAVVRPVLPLAMRVKIVRVCAANAMTKEFAADDLEALAVMVGAL
jgi:hypothetical protein